MSDISKLSHTILFFCLQFLITGVLGILSSRRKTRGLARTCFCRKFGFSGNQSKSLDWHVLIIETLQLFFVQQIIAVMAMSIVCAVIFASALIIGALIGLLVDGVCTSFGSNNTCPSVSTTTSQQRKRWFELESIETKSLRPSDGPNLFVSPLINFMQATAKGVFYTLIFMGILEYIASIWASALCCSVVCCGSRGAPQEMVRTKVWRNHQCEV